MVQNVDRTDITGGCTPADTPTLDKEGYLQVRGTVEFWNKGVSDHWTQLFVRWG